MDAAGWTALVVAAIGAIGSIVLQAIHMILSYRRDTAIKQDVDVNTQLTKDGTEKASQNAAVAANAAKTAAAKSDAVAAELNGKLETRITSIVHAHTEPIIAVLKAHAEQDDRNMAEVRKALGELRDRTTARA
jgi:hypothetical protein